VKPTKGLITKNYAVQGGEGRKNQAATTIAAIMSVCANPAQADRQQPRAFTKTEASLRSITAYNTDQ